MEREAIRVGPYLLGSQMWDGAWGPVVSATGKKGPVLLTQLDPVQREAPERMKTLAKAVGDLGAPFLGWQDAGVDGDGRPYTVTTHPPGESLRQRLTRGPLGQDAAVELVRGLADGLGRVHRHGRFHGGISLDEIFVDDDGHGWLSQLGLAEAAATPRADLASDPSRTGICYLAPEQTDGRSIGPPADVFALGLVLYRCLTGVFPYTAVGREKLRAQILAGGLRPFDGETLPRWLRSVLVRALAPKPEDRPNDGDSLAEVLARRCELAPLSSHFEDELRHDTGYTEAVKSLAGVQTLLKWLTILFLVSGGVAFLLSSFLDMGHGALVCVIAGTVSGLLYGGLVVRSPWAWRILVGAFGLATVLLGVGAVRYGGDAVGRLIQLAVVCGMALATLLAPRTRDAFRIGQDLPREQRIRALRTRLLEVVRGTAIILGVLVLTSAIVWLAIRMVIR